MRERVETNCRYTRAKDGVFSPKIGKATAERLTKYCRLENINRTKFIEQCINAQLDVLEQKYYESLSKEDLIRLIMEGGK